MDDRVAAVMQSYEDAGARGGFGGSLMRPFVELGKSMDRTVSQMGSVENPKASFDPLASAAHCAAGTGQSGQ